MKKILANVLDVVIFFIFLLVTVLIISGLLVFVVFKLFSTNLQDVKAYFLSFPEGKDILEIARLLFLVFMAYVYFRVIPKKMGNTFGKKILKIPTNIDAKLKG